MGVVGCGKVSMVGGILSYLIITYTEPSFRSLNVWHDLYSSMLDVTGYIYAVARRYICFPSLSVCLCVPVRVAQRVMRELVDGYPTRRSIRRKKYNSQMQAKKIPRDLAPRVKSMSMNFNGEG